MANSISLPKVRHVAMLLKQVSEIIGINPCMSRWFFVYRLLNDFIDLLAAWNKCVGNRHYWLIDDVGRMLVAHCYRAAILLRDKPRVRGNPIAESRARVDEVDSLCIWR